MSAIVIKTSKGRQYRYLQRSYREGERVRTESIYLGPVDGGRRKGLLKRVGELIEANRAEPGTRALNQMIEEGQKQAALRANAERNADEEFYARMHALYGMTKGPANPTPVDKAISPIGHAAPSVPPAPTESPSAEEGAEAAEATPSE